MTHLMKDTRHNDVQYDTTTAILLEFFEMIAFIGLLFCLLALTHGVIGVAMEGLLLYTIWFAVTTLGIYAMKRGDAWGAYGILVATAVVTLFDILTGKATIGGASLGILVLVVVGVYLRSQPLARHDDSA